MAAERAREEADRAARVAAEEAAARALELESMRVRQEAEARLQSELDRVRREAETARRADQADAERIRAEAAAEARAVAEATLARETERARTEANARIAREVQQLKVDAERKRSAELDEMRAQVIRLRDAAAEKARSAAAAAVETQVARATTVVRTPPRESFSYGVAEHSAPRRGRSGLVVLAACALVLAAGGYTMFSNPDAVYRFTEWFQRLTAVGEPPAPTDQEPPSAPAPTVSAPKAPARRQTAAGATGVLAVTSTPPGAEVSLDGKPHGKTPAEIKDVTVGTHTVVVQGDVGSFTRSVSVKSGTRTTVEATFEPGYLSIVSRLQLDIFLGSRRIGSSDDEKVALPAGTHRLTFINKRVGFRGELTVDIKAGEVTAYSVSPPTGGLVVKTTAGAEIFMDGQSLGVAPLGELEVPVGVHNIVVKHPELGEKPVTVEIKRDQSQDITVTFPGAPAESPKPEAPKPPPPPAKAEPPKPKLAPLSAPPAPRR
jgi:hypothetical protein